MTKKPVEKVIVEKVGTDSSKTQEKQYGYSVKLGNVLHAAEQEQIPHKQPAKQPPQEEVAPKPKRLSVIEVKERVKALVKPSNIKEIFKPSNLKNTALTTYKAGHTHLNSLTEKSITAIDKFSDFITHEEGEGRNEVVQKARSPILFGVWVSILTFVVGGLWSLLAPLDKGVHAMGYVVAASKKQLIQHRDGGVLESIKVQEGQEVQAGDILITIGREDVLAGLKSAKIQNQATKEQLKAMEELYKKGFVARDHLLRAQMTESEAEARLKDLEDKADRLVIKAPIAGTVNQIQVHTIGSTIPPGATLMTITPTNDDLIIEAYVTPQDIDLLQVGLEAKINVTAFRHRSVGYFFGKVTFVSPDALDPSQLNHYAQENMYANRGMSPYKVRIEVDKEQLKHISKYRAYTMRPGMQADVTIVTGKRTLFQYMMDPLTATFMHAFKEQ